MWQQTPRHPLALVCLAAPEDAALLARWEIHLHPLQQRQYLSLWSERHLAAGTDRMHELRRQMDGADLIILLLSADFFANPECCTLMEQALERARTSSTGVIPLLLRAATWKETPLGTLTPWPCNGLPITQWNDQEAAWQSCIQELRRLLGRQVSEDLASGRSHKQTDPDRDRMLRRLSRSYKELLDQSLHGIAWMELGLATRPDLVSNVTTTPLLFRLPHQGERLLAPGTSLLDVFDEAEGELLILGAPGAGKSTQLLELAQQLVGRAQTRHADALPILLRLSSWANGRPELSVWMMEQLARTYDVPRRLAERWIKEGRVLPLLDGLDEMGEAARPACIAAINSYHRTHLTSLVVCSRHAEYEVLSKQERLALQGAVIVQPLDEEQIDRYLSADPSFAGVRAALHQEEALRELATTPLMLSVLVVTYRGASASTIIQQGTDLERQVWADYVARQVVEKGNEKRYPLPQTHAWLTFLARQMRVHQQTTFYAEYLDDDWLAHKQQQMVTWLATRLPAMLIGACVSLLVFLFLNAGNPFVVLLQIGLLGGFIGNSFGQQGHPRSLRVPSRSPSERWVHLGLAVLLGVLLAASFGFSLGKRGYTLSDWARDGSIFGLGSGVSFWIFQQILSRLPGSSGRQGSRSPSWMRGLTAWLTRMATPSVWLVATTLGAGIGLISGLRVGLREGLDVGLDVGLNVGLSAALSLSIIVVLVHTVLAGSIGPLRFAERIQWTWRGLLRPGHLRSSLFLAGMLSLFFELSAGLGVGLVSARPSHRLMNYGLSVGMSYGPSEGLSAGLSIGLSAGLSAGLCYWVVLGLYQGIQQEHLEDHNRRQFNQGIRRSLRNGLFLSLLSALLITTTNVLSVGLSSGLSVGLRVGLRVGLSERLREGLSVGLNPALITLFASILVMWTLSGGLTILRHYVIRWLLARHRTLPWRAQAFLDDATTRILLRRVGGGYSFIHRRLQDYFADMAAPPSQK